jgi:hypothetical protein
MEAAACSETGSTYGLKSLSLFRGTQRVQILQAIAFVYAEVGEACSVGGKLEAERLWVS